MIRTILVPLDGSGLAEQALGPACRLARATQATLVLVRAVRGGAGLQDPLAARQGALAAAEEYLRRIAQRLAATGVAAQTDMYCTPVAEAILLAAKLHGADLIAMSTHGRSGLRRAVLGSEAERVLHAALIPVLLMPARRSPALQPPASCPYGTLLVPLDGTGVADAALRYVAREPFARAARFVLLHVEVPAMPSLPEDMLKRRYAPAEPLLVRHPGVARRYLDALGQVCLGGCPWSARVERGDPGRVILDVARHEGMDLIAMGTHGRGGLDRLLHGSVAAQVLHRAEVPVLLVPETAAGAAERVPAAEVPVRAGAAPGPA